MRCSHHARYRNARSPLKVCRPLHCLAGESDCLAGGHLARQFTADMVVTVHEERKCAAVLAKDPSGAGMRIPHVPWNDRRGNVIAVLVRMTCKVAKVDVAI